jgi:tetratricopeptide (TPR) repeat protein
MQRRQFIKLAAAAALASKLRAEDATKHLVAYSMNGAYDVVKEALRKGTDFRATEPAIYFLGGITEPSFFMCGDETSDWILIGERNAKSPALTLDDLVVAIRSSFLHSERDPGITIDPRGGADGATIQDVKFFGGVENTAFGQTCFDADWLMKKIGMKLEVLPVEGLRTFFDLAVDEARDSGSLPEIVSRFWYVPSLNNVNVVHGIAFLDQFRSGILTQVLSARVGGEKVENLAAFYFRPSAEFARSFEEHYKEIGLERPVFARLEALTKLAGLTKALRSVPPIASFSYWLSSYLLVPTKTPTEVEVLEHRDTHVGLKVSGGVTMTSTAADLKQGNADAFRQLVKAARHESQVIWEFDMEFGGSVPKSVSYPQGSTADVTILSLWGQAQFLVEQKRYEAAIALLNKIIDEVPTLQEPYNLRGFARAADGSGEKALLDFDQAIRINPRYAEAYFNRGNTNSSLLRYADAIRDYSQAVDSNPAMVEAYLNRGIVLSRRADKTAALADFEKALSLNPRFALAYFDRGLLKEEMGDAKWALQDFDQALKLDPHLAKAYLEKGSLLEAQGNDEEALRCYERFLMYDLPDEDEQRYSKEVVRIRAEELMKDVAIGLGRDYEGAHGGVPLAERLRKIRSLNGVGAPDGQTHSTK